MSSLDRYRPEQNLMSIIIQNGDSETDIAILNSKVRSYFGKGNYSIKYLIHIDKQIAKNYLHHLWIAAICATILFSLMGLLILVVAGLSNLELNPEILWIAAPLFLSAAIIPGFSF
jgi:hypothetical protein